MGKLVGGDYLLDLTPIEIEQSEDGATKTNITNADVLKQLTNLKKYVKNPDMIKPVWVKFVNGETDELVVARGTFAVVDSGEFEIVVAIDGYKLRISIEFTQAELEDHTPIDDWYIDTNDAKYLFTSDAQNIGAISELPVFENIVDAQGHKRFIEGDITCDNIEGLTQKYGKWSLSGSHLLIVISCEVLNGTAISGKVAEINLPRWVIDKMRVLYGASAVIRQNDTAFATDGASTQQMLDLLSKADNKVYFFTYTTFTADRAFRVQFDLLIDNEEPESQGE